MSDVTTTTTTRTEPPPDPAAGSPYVAYSYSYPHKTAYRPLAPPRPLRDLWQGEPQQNLFLYLHVPFCEHRCGFCNLFTQAGPAADIPERYLAQLRCEAERVRAAFDGSHGPRFARLAVGGGTPTFLTLDELRELFAVATDVMGVEPAAVPTSIEVSPATVDADKLRWLRDIGVDRISIGVESFLPATNRRLGRPQSGDDVQRALEQIRTARFPTLNIDLIYGGEGESTAEWLASVTAALAWRPEELYLYPLYVRPLTGLGRLGHSWDDQRLDAYRSARDLLLGNGYQQVSMRMFRDAAAAHSPLAPRPSPLYCCQSDGMVGLGCGARSYTAAVHYSTEYAVGRRGVRAILGDYLSRPPESFDAARHGYQLSEDDRRRRHVILSLLQCEGLSRPDYQSRFGADVLEHLPPLAQLARSGLAEVGPERIRLTPRGIERSDAIGPWLDSEAVRRRMREYELK